MRISLVKYLHFGYVLVKEKGSSLMLATSILLQYTSNSCVLLVLTLQLSSEYII
uniref:Uncharacterized protein n=1 Tax=Anguilla anguilla TaxID=7936 RepID=A0A0E9XCZ9_ANGAN